MSIKYNFYLKVLNIVFGEDFWRKNTRSDRETYFHTSEGARNVCLVFSKASNTVFGEDFWWENPRDEGETYSHTSDQSHNG